jgi:hypothetical protein
MEALVVFVRREKTTRPPVLEWTYTFDLDTGLLLRMDQQEKWKNGDLLQESWEVFEYEFLAALEEETLDRITTAEAELRSFISRAGGQPSPTVPAP